MCSETTGTHGEKQRTSPRTGKTGETSTMVYTPKGVASNDDDDDDNKLNDIT